MLISQLSIKIVLWLLVSLICFVGARAQTTSFTYQGRLSENSTAANGTYQMQFALFDAPAGGSQIGAIVTDSNVQVSNGIFTVNLDFGVGAFSGGNRYLQIGIASGAGGSFVLMNPRQPITSAPYAVKSLNSSTAENSLRLGGINADQYVLTTDPRLNQPGGGNFIQNSTALQTADFNLNGNGAANIFSAQFQYNIGPNRVLSVAGTNNLFVGVNSGPANSSGFANSFFGRNAGAANTSGAGNAFFGKDAGFSNTGGINNSFFGLNSGGANTTGGFNSFFGTNTGSQSTDGFNNAFFGNFSGSANTTGSLNSFVGNGAGNGNTTGSNNTMLGAFADVGAGNLSYATAVGAEATVSTSNTIVLDRGNGQDTVTVPGTLQILALGGAGSTQLCRNGTNRIAACSSSLRYKTNLAPFGSGLSLVSRLRPITFDWKDGGTRDLGLGAEEVAAVEPLLVTYNKDGQIEGVKYDRIGVVLLNAVQEQQAEIESLRAQIESLKKLVCSQNARAEICK